MLDAQTFYPESDLLKKYVAYFYCMKTGSGSQSKYYVFPHTFQSVNIHRQAKFTFLDHGVLAEEDTSNKYVTVTQGRIDRPFHVELKGSLDQVTIVFKPLGLNNFICSSFREVAPGPLQLFTAWNTALTDSLYQLLTNEERIAFLERWLLSVHTPIREQAELEHAIALLTDFSKEMSIEQVAATIGLNSRTFHRVFQKHLGIAPVKFRKIARFRHSLSNKLFNDQFDKLTKIGYASNFYDQSYFNKIYQQMAGSSPGIFFHSIDTLANENMVLQYVK